MTCGVAYPLTGMAAAERLVVSAWSLRRHWSGPVAICATPDCTELAGRLCDALDCQRHRLPARRTDVRHEHYLLKPTIALTAPFERTLLLDADTLIVDSLDHALDNHEPLTVAAFSNWVTTSRRMNRRLNWFRGRSPYVDALVDAAQACAQPAINTGVVVVDKGNPDLLLWKQLTDLGAGLHMSDELAMQLLLAGLDPNRYAIVSDRFNCSPIYGVEKDQVVIWHFHGRKHLRKDVCRAIWEPAFRACLADNVAGLADWAGRYDKEVQRALESN